MTDTEWLQWRAGGVGAFDIARADSGHYGGAYRVVAEKLGLAEPNIDPEDAARGHRWELAIADGVHALTGLYVHGEQLWVTSPENDRWLATIDGLVDSRPELGSIDEAAAVLEVKTSRQHVTPKWGYYTPQVQWQMLVTGKQQALVAVAVIGVDLDGDETVRDLQLRWVERDQFHIERLVDLAGWLLDHIDNKELPEPDEHTDPADVRSVNRDADSEVTVDIDDLADVIAHYDALKEQAKQATGKAKQLEATIRHRMGEAVEAHTSDGRWRLRVGQPVQRFTAESESAALLLHPECAKTVLDRDRFKAEHPGLYDELKQPSTDRRLTIKETS